jgi:D-3-phosphoglycerate dehydrogenase/C-terminal binding protein
VSEKKYMVLMPDVISNPDIEMTVFSNKFQMITPNVSKVDDISLEVWRNVDAIMGWHTLRYDSKLIKQLDNCKIIIRIGVGFDNVDLKVAGKLGIIVSNVPDYGTTDVADHAIALLLSFSRGIFAYSDSVINNQWSWEHIATLKRLSGSTMGIVGLGRIGTATAMRAKGLGMKVLFYDPYLVEGVDKALAVGRCYDLNELLAQSDVVSLHTPLTDETKGMANRNFFKAMKPGSIFINTARGLIVDPLALYDALKSGHLSAVGVDVWPTEPPPDSDPLIKAWKVGESWVKNRFTLTPHSAFFCQESWEELRMKGSMEVKRVLKGERPRSCVNSEWLVNPRNQRKA